MVGLVYDALLLIDADDKFDIFVNLLVIFLALLGALGYGIYRFMLREFESKFTKITKDFEDRISTATRTERAEDSMRLRIGGGYSTWLLYRKLDGEVAAAIKKATGAEIKFDEFLTYAIVQTEIALYRNAPEVDQRQLEELITVAKNNLAYYLACRRAGNDCERAKKLAKCVQERIPKYTEHKEAWEDTCRFVQEKCGD